MYAQEKGTPIYGGTIGNTTNNVLFAVGRRCSFPSGLTLLFRVDLYIHAAIVGDRVYRGTALE